MSGFIVEYVENGWPTIQIQFNATEAHFDKTNEVLSIWEFQDADEMALIISELRAFRNQQVKEKS